jgi:hypothetical protein
MELLGKDETILRMREGIKNLSNATN